MIYYFHCLNQSSSGLIYQALYQAGFLVARRDPSIIEDALNVVREGNYVDSFSSENGWGGKGYGAFVGELSDLLTWSPCVDENRFG